MSLSQDEIEFQIGYERCKAQPESGVVTPAGNDGSISQVNSRRALPFLPYPFPVLKRSDLELVA